ncbi:ECF transporter S component [Anaerorhabdus furcosa]|uniref:Riboflavin transporter n=1 Tax=Anaerorhabdus furcosa TaxID=118967 RepID=A0A1T4N492_9FIRM|nr:ECF transporter S component [Anaerorhabdus furcosa]SJZ73946.1 Riboflavin transporter FmnP [Anaerorhabdus furcosa]
MNSRVKKLAVLAMLCAIAYVVMVVGRIPIVLFLKYDPKDVIITLGGFMYGPLAALAISSIVSIIEMITVSGTGVIGCIMNIISSCSFACVAAFIYKRNPSFKSAIIGLVIGVFTMTLGMMIWNYLITPLYMGIAREAVVKLLIPAFLPFNLFKGCMNLIFVLLLYKPVLRILKLEKNS